MALWLPRPWLLRRVGPPRSKIILLMPKYFSRVSYRNGEMCSLHINIYKQHIYKQPRYAMSLQCWSEELAHLGFHAPYRGEGVASYTHQVVMALVKNKRKRVSRNEGFTILEAYGHKCAICGDKGDDFPISWNWITQCLCETVETTIKV